MQQIASPALSTLSGVIANTPPMMDPLPSQDFLGGLWNRLQVVAKKSLSIDSQKLDQEDKIALQEIQRITAGYTCLVLELSAQAQTEPVPIPVLSHVSQVVSLHCESCRLPLDLVLSKGEGAGPALTPVRFN